MVLVIPPGLEPGTCCLEGSNGSLVPKGLMNFLYSPTLKK